MKKIFLIAATALALAACDSNEDNPATSPVAIKISATIGESPISRAVDDKWSEGDRIGISSTVGSVDGPYVNLEYTTDGDGSFTGSRILFYKPMTLKAYYPFTGEENKVPGENGVIKASTGSDNQKPETQPKIDFLWDSQTGFTATDPNVKFNFVHKMSKVTFCFLSSTPMEDENGIMIAKGVDVRTMISYVIEGLGVEGTFDTATGVCAIDETKGRTDLAIEFKKTKPEGEEDDYKSEREFPPLIVFPQTFKERLKLHIYTDELNNLNELQHYICQLGFSDGKIEPGLHYKYTIKVTKTGLILGKMTVEPWNDQDKFMTATIDGDGFKVD